MKYTVSGVEENTLILLQSNTEHVSRRSSMALVFQHGYAAKAMCYVS
jgi:hypothetical protein